MIKIKVIRSINSEIPLAQVRTDGHNLEWDVDNYGLQAQGIQSYQDLEQFIATSHTLSIADATEGEVVPQLRSFLLSTGDILSMTDDGKSVTLNNKLLNDIAKEHLSQLITTQQIQVQGEGAKTNLAVPNFSPKKAPTNADEVYQNIDFKKEYAEDKKKSQGSAYHDPEIEKDFDDGVMKQLMYLKKHGKYEGGVESQL